MQKKILFISYDGMTDSLGQSQVIPYLQGLSKKGFEFHLLSCEKKEAFAANENIVRELLKDFNIQWHHIPYTKKPPVLSTLKDVNKLKSKAIQIHEQFGIDMVHTRPGIPALVGLWMKKKYGIKFLHDIREFYADSRVEGGMWNINNPLYKTIYNYFKKKESEQIELSDGIVCLTHAAEKITKQTPEYKNDIPLSVIPCSADLNLFNPNAITEQQKNTIKQQFGFKESDFIISYLGSVGGWYMTNEMFTFCKLLSTKMPEAKFLFISPIHHHAELMNEVSKHGLPKEKVVITHGSRNEVPQYLSISSYSLFFIKPCFSKLSSSPTKHGEIMAMGVPVITNSGVGDVKEIVEKYNGGFVIDDFSENAFASIIDKLKAENNFNKELIMNGAKEYYSLQKAVDSYGRLYDSVFN